MNAPEPPTVCEQCGAETERGLTLEAFGTERRWVCHRCAPTRRRRTPLPPMSDPGSEKSSSPKRS